jgi:hypothetical protein
MEITTAVVGCGALVGGFVIGYVFNYCNTFTKRNADEFVFHLNIFEL